MAWGAVGFRRAGPWLCEDGMNAMPQRILVFQQNGSGLAKIAGIEAYGKDVCHIEVIDIDPPLPLVLDDTEPYLPDRIQADLVLDFLKHPDLSYDLADLCFRENIPVVASGKKEKCKGVTTPPT